MRVKLVLAYGLQIGGAWSIGPLPWKKQNTWCVLQIPKEECHTKPQ